MKNKITLMMRSYIKAIFGLILITFSSAVFAQDNFVVRGKILDAANNEPVIGANVIETGADNRFLNGTITDFNGDFVIEVASSNATLKIQFIGYKDQVIPIEGKSYFSIKIEEDVTQLAEATIVSTRMQSDGLVEIAERNLTGSQMKIDMESMQEVAATTAEEALQGEIAGVDIVMNSGDPGSGSSMVIRGMSSLNGSQPLFVINGIPQSIKPSGDFDFGSADSEDIGTLISVPPADIKSITVLKDAASTAQYGTEGANGVIVIETKKGKKGPTRFRYSFKYNYNEQPPAIPMLNGDEYVMLQLEQRFNPSGIFTVPVQLENDPNYALYHNYGKNTDWLDAVSQDGIEKEHSFQVSGGGDKTRYFASVNYTDSKGTTLGTGLNRLATRINLDYDVSEKIKFNAEFAFTNSKFDQQMSFGDPDADEDKKVNIRNVAYSKAPNMSIYEYDQYGIETGKYFTPLDNYQGSLMFNPVAMADLGKNYKEQNKIATNIKLIYNIYKTELKFTSLVSYVYDNTLTELFIPSEALGYEWTSGANNQAANSSEDSRDLLVRGQLVYNKVLDGGNHVINTALTVDAKEGQTTGLGVWTSKTASSFITDPAAVSELITPLTKDGKSRKISGRYYVNYVLKDRYIANINFALEGSTKFGVNERWGFFPSGSLAWRFGSEPLLESQQQWLGKETKLKFSYGINGNENGINSYDRHALYGIGSTYIENKVIYPRQVQLDNLKWETTSQMNIALDAQMFRNKLDFVAEIYSRNTTDILWTKNYAYQLPLSSGYSSLKAFNAGEVENRGWEFQANYQVFKNQKWLIRLSGNVANNFNRFLSLPDNFVLERNLNLGNGNFPVKANIGQPVGSYYGLKYLGVYASDADAYAKDANGNVIYDLGNNPLRMSYNGNPATEFYGGDAIYDDINHDGTINYLDAVYLGNSNPDIIGGLGLSIKYGQFSFKANLFSRYNFEIINRIAINTQGMAGTNNQSKAVLHRWRRQGMEYDDLIPRAYKDHKFNNLGSDRYVERGDFLRLNNVSLIYDVPKSVCAKLNVQKLTFSLNGRKLATWTRYTGQDPEIPPTGADPFFVGQDRANTPVPKKLSFSVIVDF